MRERRRFARRHRGRGRRTLWLAIVLLAAFVLTGLWRPQWFLELEFARQRWQAGADEASVAIDGQRWQYLQAGNGPPLLLLHGFTGSKENWLPVIDALARHHRVIAPDLPGSGYGDPPPQPPFGFSADAVRLQRFIETVVGPAPIVLVGHSMGGGIAAVYAATHPERVERLVLISAAGVEFENDFAEAALLGGHPFAVHDRASLDRYLRLVFVDPPWLPWPADRALIARRVANDAAERRLLAAISTLPGAADPQRAAPAIRAPTLLLWCRGDRVVDAAAGQRYRELIADSTLVLLDGCNHMPMMERPDATVQAISTFIGE